MALSWKKSNFKQKEKSVHPFNFYNEYFMFFDLSGFLRLPDKPFDHESVDKLRKF